jgi:hypothetical protein
VNQCVLAKCKPIVGDTDWSDFQALWQSILKAPTIEEYEKRWLEFKTQYSNPKTHQCIVYLQNQWLKEGQKERLVTVWTDQYTHFGIRTTSRGEGAHAYIKRYLGGKKSKGDLYTTWLLLEAAVINQITTVSSKSTTQQDYTPVDIDRLLYQGCFRVITWYALRLVQKHLTSVSLPLQPCTGRFTHSMGLPCAYTCNIRRATGGLTLLDFHTYWYWDSISYIQPLRNPVFVGRRYIPLNRIASSGRILSRGK